MEFYHVLNRGINKMNIFLDDGDRMRFIKGMYTYNDANPVPNPVSQRTIWLDDSHERIQLVTIHAWCLMDNHYHMLLSPTDDDFANISLFMRKLNMGYAKFFNEKYDRSGYLWQGKYKKIKIERDAQFMYIPYYIHLNPLDFSFKEWRKGCLDEAQFNKAKIFLDSYRWSSWLDYTGQKNFPSIVYKNILREILKNKNFQLNEVRTITSNDLYATNSEYIET